MSIFSWGIRWGEGCVDEKGVMSSYTSRGGRYRSACRVRIYSVEGKYVHVGMCSRT